MGRWPPALTENIPGRRGQEALLSPSAPHWKGESHRPVWGDGSSNKERHPVRHDDTGVGRDSGEEASWEALAVVRLSDGDRGGSGVRGSPPGVPPLRLRSLRKLTLPRPTRQPLARCSGPAYLLISLSPPTPLPPRPQAAKHVTSVSVIRHLAQDPHFAGTLKFLINPLPQLVWTPKCPHRLFAHGLRSDADSSRWLLVALGGWDPRLAPGSALSRRSGFSTQTLSLAPCSCPRWLLTAVESPNGAQVRQTSHSLWSLHYPQDFFGCTINPSNTTFCLHSIFLCLIARKAADLPQALAAHSRAPEQATLS